MAHLFAQIMAQFKYIPRALLIALMFCFVYMYIRDNGRDSVRKFRELLRQKWLVMFLLYTAYIVTSTILIRYSKTPYLNVFSNLCFQAGNAGNNIEIIKNILFFIPYTILFLQAFRPPKPIRSCILLSAGSTLFIELSQLLFWCGEFQVADLIDNFTGGMIGCALWLVSRFVVDLLLCVD